MADDTGTGVPASETPGLATPTVATPVVTPPTVATPKAPTDQTMTARQHLQAMADIEKAAGGFSNIGIQSDYWFHRSEYRRMTSS